MSRSLSDSRLAAGGAAAALALLLTSCPSPLTDSVVNNARDTVPPAVTIVSPVEYSSFGRTIEIEGQASDFASRSGARGQVVSLVYEILARTAPKAVTLAAGGSFRIDEATDLRENIVVEIRATDWNGNVTAVRLPLVWEGNDIPTFAAASGNRQVTLTWDPVPGVTGYTIYYETSALAPTTASPGHLDNVTSPYVLNNLKNGTVYSFLLRGVGSAQDNYSSVQRATPLSTFNLYPSVDPHFNYIEVSWQPFATLSQYEVMRATSPGGPFESVSGPVSGSSYRDTSVQQDVLYYYAVKPAQYSEVLSEYAEAAADPFPTYRDADITVYGSVQVPQATAVKGNYLLVADFWGGLYVADISQPATPTPVTQVSSVVGANDVVVSGNYAYVSHYQSLSVFDVTNPASPQLLDTLQVTSSQAEGVAVLGNLAFVACFNDGFSLVDVTDKIHLALAAHNDGTAQALVQTYNVAAVDRGSGVTALFVAANAKTAVYEVTGAASSPTITLRSTSMSWGRDIKVVGNTAYVSGTSGGLSTYNVSSLTAPSFLDSIQPIASAVTEALDVSGARAYVTMRDTGFAVVDATNPSNLTLVQSYTVAGEALGVTVDGAYAYVASGQNYGIAIYGVAALRTPTVAGSYTSLSGSTNLALSRDHALVTETANDWRMTVVDASTPSSLALSGTGLDYTPENLEVVGRYAVFASERSGIERWDISDLTNPHVIPPWYVNLPGGYAVSIDVRGSYAYVGTSQSSLDIVDLTWPDNMALAGSIATQGNTAYAAADVAVGGGYAFVANSQAGLRIVDVSDPKWPSMLTGYGAVGGSAVAVGVSGSYAFVADSTNGLCVFDVSNPPAMAPATAAVFVSGGGGATDVVVRGNFAYVAKGANGIQVWDITNPKVPVSVLSYDTVTFAAQKLAVSREYLYAIDGASTLRVLDLLP